MTIIKRDRVRVIYRTDKRGTWAGHVNRDFPGSIRGMRALWVLCAYRSAWHRVTSMDAIGHAPRACRRVCGLASRAYRDLFGL